jgi:glycosyltransferase involved in cell wall biosynthesis
VSNRVDPVMSVVVPTRGRPEYLARCLSALADADYPGERFEVIVVNDGDDQRVARAVSSAADRLTTTLAVPARSGPSIARNTGAREARGRYLAFTDDDCEPSPGWLPALERTLTAEDGAAVGGRTLNGATDNAPAVATQLVVDFVHAHFNRDPRAPRFFASYNVAFPAEAFRALGGFDERFRYAEDREMCERWVRTGHRFAHAPDALVHHMRTLSQLEFLGQHYGYGRGAWAFHLKWRGAGPGGGDRVGILRALLREARRVGSADRLAVAGYVALSQLATAAGFAREALAQRVASRPAHLRSTRME